MYNKHPSHDGRVALLASDCGTDDYAIVNQFFHTPDKRTKKDSFNNEKQSF